MVLVSTALVATTAVGARAQEPAHSAELDAAIIRAAKRHGVPERLVRRIVMRESRYNPRARNHSFWGLMQISYPTARSMGFKGTPEQLLNPVTNLAYAVPYLANAFVVAGRREEAAVRLYASGYYATAKNHGLLGLLRTADSKPLNGVPDEPPETATAVAAADTGGWSFFGSSAPAAAPEAAAPSATAGAADAPQQLAYAAAPATGSAQAQIETATHPASAGEASRRSSEGKGGDATAMVAGRDGTMAPPKRWQHDGGTSVVMRGEQRIEQVAAYRQRSGETVSARRSRKSTLFAQLEPAAAIAIGGQTATDAQPQAQPTAFYASAPAAAANPPADDARASAAHLAAAEAAGTSAPVVAADDDGGKPKRRRRHHR